MWSSSDEFLPSKSLFSNPLYNTSFLLTSTTSLDMCTESLGSESGCGIDHLPAPPPEDLITTTRAKPKKRAIKHGPAAAAAACFPPPLSSIGGVHVQAHREGGRLVIKAYAFSSVFQAERGNGRLRLSLVNGAAAAAEMEMDGGGDGGYHVIEDGGKVWSSGSRCNGERRKKLQSLQFCVIGV